MQNRPLHPQLRSRRFSQWFHTNIFFWEFAWVIFRWILLVGMLVGFAFFGGWLFEPRPTLSPPERPISLPNLGSNSNVVAFSNDSRYLVTSSSDATIHTWDLQSEGNQPESTMIQGQETNLITAALSSKGSWLAVSGMNNQIWLYDRSSMKINTEPIVLTGHTDQVTRLAFSEDEKWLVSGGNDARLILWNLTVANKQDINAYAINLTGHAQAITAVAFHPGNRWLASGSADGMVILWNLNLSQEPQTLVSNSIQLTGHSNAITDLVYSPTGHWLAAGSKDDTVILWDILVPLSGYTQTTAVTIDGLKDDVIDLEFTPYGQYLVVATDSKRVRLYNMNVIDIPGQNPIILFGHRSNITSVTVTADRRWLVTTSKDKRVRLWNLSVEDIAGQDPIVLRNHTGKVLTAITSPNSQFLATVDDRNSILVYDLSTIHTPVLSVFNQNSLRYIILPLAALVAIMLAASAFVQDIYNLPSLKDGLQYVISSMFGLNYPQLVIDNGKAMLNKGEINLLKAVGGPGFIMIQPGNAAFFRYLRRPSGARINRYVFLGPFEAIGAIVNLDDQDGFVESWKCTTLDGIPVELRDIRFRFRVRHIKGAQRSMDDPYPIDPIALQQRGGNITVNDRGPIPWEDSVRMAVTTIITEYIQRNTIDYLTAPRRSLEAPRHEFTQYVLKNARVQRIGAEILWVDVGHFHILDDNVEKTRVDAWAVEQQGIVEQKLARSEADKEIMRELGRAEGQIEIIRSITLALQEAQIPVNERENIHRIFLTRVAHILKALESRQSLPTTENPPSENKPEKP